MIFIQLFYNNFLFYTYIIFLFFLSITLIFVPTHNFLCKNIVVYLVVKQIEIQITLLFYKYSFTKFSISSQKKIKKITALI